MTIVRRLLLVALLVTVASAAIGCGTSAATPSPSADRSAPADPPPSEGSGDGNGGIVIPPDGGGGGGFGQPGVPEVVVPKPGQQMVHPVAVAGLEARVDGRRVILNARWWSGVEPCSVLDSVGAVRDGGTITVSLFEGTSNPDAVCIAIAVEKVTVIDLGELDPGTYTVVADPGDAAAIVVEVP